MNKLSQYVERVNLIYWFSRENLLGGYIKVLLVTFISIVYSNAAQASTIVVRNANTVTRQPCATRSAVSVKAGMSFFATM